MKSPAGDNANFFGFRQFCIFACQANWLYVIVEMDFCFHLKNCKKLGFQSGKPKHCSIEINTLCFSCPIRSVPGAAPEIQSHGGKFVKKKLSLRGEYVFSPVFLRQYVANTFLKKLWGIFPYNPPLAPPLVNTSF